MNELTLKEFEENIEELTNERIVLIGCPTPEILEKVFSLIKRELENVYTLENSNFDNIDLSFKKKWNMDIQDAEGTILIFQPDLIYDSSLIPYISDILVRWFGILGHKKNIIFIVTKKMLDDLAFYTNDFQEQYRRLYGFQVIP